MKYLLAAFALLISVEVKADVLVCTDPAACTTTIYKPKSALVGSDQIKWCSTASGDITGLTTGCTTQQWYPYGWMQSFSWVLTDTGWYTVSTVPATVVPPPPPYVATKADCLPKQVLGSGSIALYDTVNPRGGFVFLNPSVITYYCIKDGWYWKQWTYAGNLSTVYSSVAGAVKSALFGDSQPLLDMTGKTTRPLTDEETAVAKDLAGQITVPILWWIKPSTTAGATTRPVYKITPTGTVGTKIGNIAFSPKTVCDCSDPTKRVVNSTSTYCSVQGQPIAESNPVTNFGTDAITICTNK